MPCGEVRKAEEAIKTMKAASSSATLSRSAVTAKYIVMLPGEPRHCAALPVVLFWPGR